MSPVPAPHQTGAALLTVLLLVAVISVVIMGLLDDVRFSVHSAGNAQAMDQAQRYAIGAEEYARTRISSLSNAYPIAPAASWNGIPMPLPLDEGMLQATLHDGNACFNLNSVVQGGGEFLQRSETGSRQYRALLVAMGVPQTRADMLTDVLVDWIDTDQQPGQQGAEDPIYQARTNRYRTSGTLLAEASELRALNGYDAALYARLRPLVCALPESRLTPLDLNALDRHHAPLLVAVTEGRLSGVAARQVIANRPANGWQSLAAFWKQPQMAQIVVDNPVLEQLALRPRHFRLDVQVQHGRAQMVMTALLGQEPGARAVLLSRRWSFEE